jgi:diguanylate cyclase (GGDEF)-like protein
MARSLRKSAAADRPPATTAVVYLDIDDFKDVNDRHGHGHGDALLRAVAERLRQNARAADTVARIGGDEFAVLVEEVADRADVVALTERLMDSMSDPVALPEGAVAVRLSAGLAFSDDGGGTAEAILQNADHAMYHAKRRSQGGFLIYDPDLRARSQERRRLKRALHGVVERDELRLHYQPLVRLNSGHEDLTRASPPAGTIAAFEALVRWQEPSRGLLMPAEFIEVAEETGDIMPLGRWVLETACRQLRAWQRMPGRGATTVMVNLSALEIEQRGFSEDVRRIVTDSGIAPHSLVFEITEYAVVPDRSPVRAVLGQLQDCGVHLVIDDFGTGYSSLSYLSSLPVDGLKIPRAFVRDAVGDQKARALLRAIIEVGAALGAVVVAEGIETRQEMLLMRSLGCDLGQGHLFSRPLPAADVEALLRAPQPPWAASLRPPVAIPVSAERRLEGSGADLPRRMATRV